MLAALPAASAPGSPYAREAFGPAWADTDHNGCDTRNDVLRRDLVQVQLREGTRGCVVVAGTLNDPYTGHVVVFAKAQADRVQIDHVVALSDAWRSGAWAWPAARRLAFANDPLELLATEGAVNQAKGDSAADTWLPSPPMRCAYAARQVAVKAAYGLAVTAAERAALDAVLRRCPGTALPPTAVPPPG